MHNRTDLCENIRAMKEYSHLTIGCRRRAYGAWGEEVAARRLAREGMEIVERNSRPLAADRRLEIDIVAYDSDAGELVFVEVKQHSSHISDERRVRGIDRRKLANLRKAFSAWLRKNSWHGCYRFDVVEVFGTPNGSEPEIDHIRRVSVASGVSFPDYDGFEPECRSWFSTRRSRDAECENRGLFRALFAYARQLARLRN